MPFIAADRHTVLRRYENRSGNGSSGRIVMNGCSTAVNSPILAVMSYLDDVPQVWARPELPALRDLCVSAFRSVDEAETLADEAGLAPGTFPAGRNARAVWTALIKELGRQGRLRALVQLAAQDPSARSYGPRFEEMLEDHPAVPVPAPAYGWRGDGGPANLHLQRLLARRSRLLDLELAAQIVDAARSVARLELRFGAGVVYGTGLLIGPSLLLTSYHNFASPRLGALTGAVAEFDHDRMPNPDRLAVAIDGASIVGDEAVDWAVVRLRHPVRRPPLRLGSPYAVNIDDLVVIIQHPVGAFKQFALEPIAVRYADADRVEYVADTQDGSSGSPVFNEHMHVIGLHRAEREVDVTIGGTPQTVWHNQGVMIDQVMHGLRERGIPFETNTEAPDG
jgi:hypothetical protein